MTNVLIVMCTCPDEATASDIARALVEEQRAACVNILGPVRSIFRWEGRISDESEVLLIAKTTDAAYAGLEARVITLHPYDVPEVIALPVSAGAAAYLGWVGESVTGPESSGRDRGQT